MEYPADKSEWSMDFTLFYRLDNIFNSLNKATLSLNLYLWYNLILVLYKEVAPLIDQADRAVYTESMNRLIPQFAKIKENIDTTGSFNISSTLYQELQNLEISLRDVVNKKGIYLRVKDDVSFGFRR